jgi:hypothetical protein
VENAKPDVSPGQKATGLALHANQVCANEESTKEDRRANPSLTVDIKNLWSVFAQSADNNKDRKLRGIQNVNEKI